MPQPDITGGELIREAFEDLGSASTGGFAPTLLSWSEINAYRQGRPHITLNDARVLRRMSSAFLSGLELKDPLNKPPFEG